MIAGCPVLVAGADVLEVHADAPRGTRGDVGLAVNGTRTSRWRAFLRKYECRLVATVLVLDLTGSRKSPRRRRRAPTARVVLLGAVVTVVAGVEPDLRVRAADFGMVATMATPMPSARLGSGAGATRQQTLAFDGTQFTPAVATSVARLSQPAGFRIEHRHRWLAQDHGSTRAWRKCKPSCSDPTSCSRPPVAQDRSLMARGRIAFAGFVEINHEWRIVACSDSGGLGSAPSFPARALYNCLAIIDDHSQFSVR